MNWDERSQDYAEAIHPEPGARRGERYPLDELRAAKRRLFRHGATWQRDQLRSDGVVERLARLEYRRATAKTPDAPTWDEALPEARGLMRSQARDIIIFLIGVN